MPLFELARINDCENKASGLDSNSADTANAVTVDCDTDRTTSTIPSTGELDLSYTLIAVELKSEILAISQRSATIRVLPEESVLLSRRSLLTTGAAAVLVSACSRKLAPRYQGWLLVASGTGRVMVVADLARFVRTTTVALPISPDRLYQTRDRIYAISRSQAEMVEIDPGLMQVSARIPLPGKPVSAFFESGGKTAIVIIRDPGEVALVDTARRRVIARIALPGIPTGGDLHDDSIAVGLENRASIARISLKQLKLTGESPLGGQAGPILFRRDGRSILAGIQASREIVTLDATNGELLARLPLPLSPARLCFNNDGGQMFVTGEGVDSVAIVNAYQNEVDQTVLAGHKPGAMAVSPQKNLLLLANPVRGDLTILDIDTRRLAASVHTGASPEDVLMTPDGEYSLVVDRASGNTAVIRISTALDHKNRAKPLFTVFPTAVDAVSAIIVPFS